MPKPLLALVLAVAAASLPAIAASPAAAFQSEGACAGSSDTSEACTDEPGEGISGDPFDGGSADTGAPAVGGSTGGNGSNGSGNAASPPEPSSTSWKNGGIDLDPFGDPAKTAPTPNDDMLGLRGPATQQRCDNILSRLGQSEENLEMLLEYISDPTSFGRSANGSPLLPRRRWPRLRSSWRQNAADVREQIHDFRTVYISKACDSVLVGGD